MDLVNIMYKYINKFINAPEVLNELKCLDLSNYSDKERKQIQKLIVDVENIINSTPNEIDEVENRRLAKNDEMLSMLDKVFAKNELEGQIKENLEKIKNNLINEKNNIRDGGKLYNDLFELLTKNKLVGKQASNMDAEELLDFITQYISVPYPPNIDQDFFNDLVNVGIKKDEREALWRLAFNYENKNKDFSLIEDYFIKKRDSYYLTELISAVSNCLNMKVLIQKIINTGDREFIKDIINRCSNTYILENEEINQLKDFINSIGE